MSNPRISYLALTAPLTRTEETFELLRVLMSTKYEGVYRIFTDLKQNLNDVLNIYYDQDRPKPKSPLFEQFVYLWCESPQQTQPVPVEDIKKAEKQIKCRIHRLLAKHYAKYGIPKINPELATLLVDMNGPLFPIARLFGPDEIAEATIKIRQENTDWHKDYRFFAFADDGRGNIFTMVPDEELTAINLYNPAEKQSLSAQNLSRRIAHDDPALEWFSQYTELRKPVLNYENLEKLDEKLKKMNELAIAMQEQEHFDRYKILFSNFAESLKALTHAHESASKTIKAAA